jgi:hypothetical protein
MFAGKSRQAEQELPEGIPDTEWNQRRPAATVDDAPKYTHPFKSRIIAWHRNFRSLCLLKASQ